uniref:Metalloendopeptidase n=1 Tax=Parastrongyloides trichosuri TaxID=131310 RepID=A0A0N4ZWE1_PARTI
MLFNYLFTFFFYSTLLIRIRCYLEESGLFQEDEHAMIKRIASRNNKDIDYRIYYTGLVNGTINRENMLFALNYLRNRTCITFTERNIFVDPDRGMYITLVPDNFTRPEENKMSQIRRVYVGETCNKYKICFLQSLLIGLGLPPEYNRYDRHKFLKFNTGNIKDWSSKCGGKLKKNNIWDYDLKDTAFDFGSLLFFSRYICSKNQEPTIDAIIPQYDNMIGQAHRMSFNNLKQLNLNYCNGVCKDPIVCKNRGYQNPKNCGRCICPNGYRGKRCEKDFVGSHACGQTVLQATTTEKGFYANGPLKCNYFISSSTGTKIKLYIKSVKTEEASPCTQFMGFEIKYRYDKGATGLCLCGTYKDLYITSENNEVVVLYNGKNGTDNFRILYQQV